MLLLPFSLAKTTGLKTVEFVDIVGVIHRQEPISDEEIAVLRTLMTSVLPYDPHSYLYEGMMAEMIREPLQGVRGIMLRMEKRHRLIQQPEAIEIDIGDIAPVQ